MGLKVMFLVAALAAYCMPVYAKPRDSSVFVSQNVVRPNEDSSPQPETGVKAYDTQGLRIPGRIRCQSLEAEEDPVCQEHCLPKGYTYGVCVSQTCSCI